MGGHPTSGLRLESTLGNGSHLQLQRSLCASLSRITQSTQTTLTRSTGTSFPQQTQTVIPTAGNTIDCGGRQGPTTEAFLVARELIQTATGVSTTGRAESAITGAWRPTAGPRPFLRWRCETSETLCRPLILFQCLATASTPTPSCGCGLTGTGTTPTPRTGPRLSSWPSTPATPSSKSTAPSLTQSTQPTYTRLLEPPTTGTRVFWEPGLHLPLNCVILAPTGLSCQRSKLSQVGRRCGPALRSSSTESLRRRAQLQRLLKLEIQSPIENKVEDIS